jgi:hypothetical protein
VRGSDEDLRYSHASVCASNHFLAAIEIPADIDFTISHALPLQQSLGGVAKGTKAGRVDFDW